MIEHCHVKSGYTVIVYAIMQLTVRCIKTEADVMTLKDALE
jgi:hypothetical protein